MFKKTSIMLALVLALSLCIFGVAMADQVCGQENPDPTTVTDKAECGCDRVTVYASSCDVFLYQDTDGNFWEDEGHTIPHVEHNYTVVSVTVNHKTSCPEYYCDNTAEREYTILTECVRNGKWNCKSWVLYGCSLKAGHTGTCVFGSRVVDKGEDHTGMYEDGCIKYECETCGGTIQNVNGHKNVCPICKVCAKTAHKYCEKCGVCYTATGVTATMYHCDICNKCDTYIHAHCPNCKQEYFSKQDLETYHKYYCATCKTCDSIEHVHCKLCNTVHPASYVYCADCKKCDIKAHEICKECKKCTANHAATCSKAICQYCGKNAGDTVNSNHDINKKCPYYQCPICKKVGQAAIDHHIAGYAVKNALSTGAVQELLDGGSLKLSDLTCGSTPCYRCGGTILKHLNVCAHCGLCNGEHLDSKKVCGCGMCEYDGVTAASKHYNYCKVCNTCGGQHLDNCTNKKGKLENPKPAWEKGGITIGDSSQNPSTPGVNPTKKPSSGTGSKSDTPKTGDNSVSYAVLLSLLALSATCFVVTRKVNAK